MKKRSGGISNGSTVGRSPGVRASLSQTANGLTFGVRVAPSASKTAFHGFYGDRLKISVSAPPEHNKANQALIEALAKWLDLPQKAFSVIAGHTSRDKVILVTGVQEEILHARIEALREPKRVEKE